MDEDKVKILVEWLKDNGNEVSEEDVEEGWGNNSFSVGGNAEYLLCIIILNKILSTPI